MRRIRKWIGSGLVGIMLLLLTGCEEDVERGRMLSGRWFGDLGMMVDGVPARGSDIEFIPYSWRSTSGYGTEVDYYGRYGMMQVVHRFEWFVRDGVVFLCFDDPGLDCSIRNYSLSADFFRGYMDGCCSSSYFTLRAYDKYWNDYGYGYEDYDYCYLPVYGVKQQVDGGTEATSEAGPICVRRQNLSTVENK